MLAALPLRQPIFRRKPRLAPYRLVGAPHRSEPLPPPPLSAAPPSPRPPSWRQSAPAATPPGLRTPSSPPPLRTAAAAAAAAAAGQRRRIGCLGCVSLASSCDCSSRLLLSPAPPPRFHRGKLIGESFHLHVLRREEALFGCHTYASRGMIRRVPCVPRTVAARWELLNEEEGDLVEWVDADERRDCWSRRYAWSSVADSRGHAQEPSAARGLRRMTESQLRHRWRRRRYRIHFRRFRHFRRRPA